MKTQVTERPRHPDGTKYEFNCCAMPQVYEHEDGSKVCEACGYDWTEVLDESDQSPR
jgi:hypothetical protein